MEPVLEADSIYRSPGRIAFCQEVVENAGTLHRKFTNDQEWILAAGLHVSHPFCPSCTLRMLKFRPHVGLLPQDS